MPATQQDIANKVKLSRSTVAKVLNNRPDVWISDQNRKRILLAASEMNYRPHAAARALRSGKSYTVALVFARQEGYSANGIGLPTEILAQYLGSIGYALLIHAVADQEQVLEKLGDLAATRGCDVVILWGNESDVEVQATLLEDLGMPFIAKGRHEATHPHWPQVDYCHEAMSAGALEHLADRGHKNIVYIGHRNNQAYATNLRRGFDEAHIRLLGRVPPGESIIDGVDVPVGGVSFDDLVVGWLHMPTEKRPTAAVFGIPGGSWLALDVALHEHGLRMGFEPGDFEAAGIGYTLGRLLFGEAYGFQNVDLGDLAAVMTQSLLPALLDGRAPATPVQRVLPKLEPFGNPWVKGHPILR